MESLVDYSFWKNKKVLITGHTGFKGSWLSLWLKLLGSKVIGISLEPKSDKDFFNACNVSNGINHHIHDIRDIKFLKELFSTNEPEIVFHLAAQALVKESYNSPRETFETNIMGTVNVCENVFNSSHVKSFVNVTSDKCYADDNNIEGYTEEDRLGGYDPYSSSKSCSELITASYRNISKRYHSQGIASARAGNVIGGGDWNENRLIPDIIKAINRGDDIIIRNPSYVRPWQHVLDPLNGYLFLAQKLYTNPQKFSGSWNFGPSLDESINVAEIVEMVINNFGFGRWKESASSQDFHETKKLFLNSKKAKELLNWSNKFSSEESVSLTTEWYKTTGSERERVSLKQIKDFMSI